MRNLYETKNNKKPFSGAETLDDLVQALNEDSKLKLTCCDFMYKGNHYQMVQDWMLDHRQIRVFWFPDSATGLGIDEKGNEIENDLKVYDTGDYRVPFEDYVLHDGMPLMEALKVPGLIVLD